MSIRNFFRHFDRQWHASAVCLPSRFLPPLNTSCIAEVCLMYRDKTGSITSAEFVQVLNRRRTLAVRWLGWRLLCSCAHVGLRSLQLAIGQVLDNFGLRLRDHELEAIFQK